MNELVAIYVRVSTLDQATEGYSIQEQTDRLTKYCEAMRWTVYNVYTDAGFSGANTERPALQRLIKDVKAGRLNKVLVYKLDRLSRSQKDTLLLIENVFLANNVDFVSMSENFDTSTPFGRAMVGILAVFAQLEREQIKERMNMGREARAKQGLFHGSCYAPIGYDYINGRLVINDFEALQIKRIYNDYANGKAPYTLVQELTEAGLSHKYGAWNDTTIRNVLRKKTYLGMIPHKGKWINGDHEPIISQELFDTVQSVLKRKSAVHREHNQRSGLVSSYLGGFLYCGKCGAKISKIAQKGGTGHKQTYNYYICNSRSKRNKKLIVDPNCENKIWKMDELNALVFGEIGKLALDPSYMTQKQESKTDDRTRIIQTEITKLDEQITRLMDLYAVGQIPLDMLQSRIVGLTDKKARLNGELQTIEQETAERLSRDDALKLVTSFGDIIKRGNFDEIRAVVTTLIEKIVVDDDDVTIYWAFS